MCSRILLCTFSLIAAAMFASVAASQTTATAAPPSTYRLQNGDTVSVFYRLTPEYNQSLTILPDGNIDLRVIGRVHLDGLTGWQVFGSETPTSPFPLLTLSGTSLR